MLGGPARPLPLLALVSVVLQPLFLNEEGEPLDLVFSHSIRLGFELEVLGFLREEKPQHMARAVWGQLF